MTEASVPHILSQRTSIDRDGIRESFERDLEQILPCFKGKSFLDIGCGVGILALLLSMKTGARAHLMDRTGNCPPHRRVKFHGGEFAFYNSMEEARENFRRNGVPVTIHAPDPSATVPVDFILSTFSWGFHYPVEIYRELAFRSLPAGGRVVMDIRKGVPGSLEGFRKFGVLAEGTKHYRVCFEKC